MGWSIGYDEKHRRDIGYGVPAVCDHPDCNAEIDRGLAYRCGEINSDEGCGLYFCRDHLDYKDIENDNDVVLLCERCRSDEPEFEPKPDTVEWIRWKLTHESWAQWREENPDQVSNMRERLNE